MTDTIIKNAGNSRSIRSVPNLAALAPTWEKALEMLTSEAGLPIDMGPLNPLGVDVMGTPLDSEHLITVEMGGYRGNGLSGPSAAVTLQFPSTPKFILVCSTYNSNLKDGFGFIFPSETRAIAIHYSSTKFNVDNLVLSVNGGTVSFYTHLEGTKYGYLMLNGSGVAYKYIAFL